MDFWDTWILTFHTSCILSVCWVNFSHSLQIRDFINARKVTQMYQVLCILKNAAFVELSILRPVFLLMASVAILKVFLRLLGKWKHRYNVVYMLFNSCAYTGTQPFFCPRLSYHLGLVLASHHVVVEIIQKLLWIISEGHTTSKLPFLLFLCGSGWRASAETGLCRLQTRVLFGFCLSYLVFSLWLASQS